MPRKPLTSRQHKHLTIELPPEFIALCKADNVPPEVVLRGFIADVCELTSWVNDPRADGYSVSGWPSHLDWRCEAANDRVHQGNRWTRWQKRESSRAGSTARS